jgi:hypothetical protein
MKPGISGLSGYSYGIDAGTRRKMLVYQGF